MKKVRILSLDGGGIRGVIPAVVVQYIEEKLIENTGNPNARIADFFDLIVGTSTGGILSCMYLAPNPTEEVISSKYTAEKALEFYSKKGYDIFNQSKRKSFGGLRQIFNATQYKPQKIEAIFETEFGELKMNQLLKPCLITTYDIKNKRSFFFSSREKPENKRSFYVKDVTRSTSAAPTYFSPAKIKNLITNKEMINIDGGVFANNPSMCAYSEARNSVFEDRTNYPSAKDMLILSIGTGAGQFNLPNENESDTWGVLKWAKSMPDIMMDASVDTVDYQIKKIFETLHQENQLNYKRIDVPFDKRGMYDSDMANASSENIENLKLAGKEAIKAAQKVKPTEHTLDKFIELLIGNITEEIIA